MPSLVFGVLKALLFPKSLFLTQHGPQERDKKQTDRAELLVTSVHLPFSVSRSLFLPVS